MNGYNLLCKMNETDIIKRSFKMERRKFKYLFWLAVALSVVFLMVCFCGLVYADKGITIEKDGTIWINKGEDNEILKKEALQRIYEEINLKLDIMVKEFRANRGFIDDIEKQKRNEQLQRIQTYTDKFDFVR